MTQPFFPCTISAQSRNNEFLTIKTVVRKTHQNNSHTGSSCLDKAVVAQGGGLVTQCADVQVCSSRHTCFVWWLTHQMGQDPFRRALWSWGGGGGVQRGWGRGGEGEEGPSTQAWNWCLVPGWCEQFGDWHG